MYARQCRDWLAGIHLRDDPSSGLEVEVDLATGDRALGQLRHVADIGEAFRAQELVGDEPRCRADVGVPG
jgi:hypothetical protein